MTVRQIARACSTAERAPTLFARGIPVLGRVGLAPQTTAMLGGTREQARTTDAASRVIEDALAPHRRTIALDRLTA